MPIIPFGEYLPDLPDYQNPGAILAKNVMPLTVKSYGPFPALSTYGNALGARCQGAFGAKDYAGNGYWFAGDSTKLYYWSQDPDTGKSWEDVSKGGGYNVGLDVAWQFTQYGNLVIACVVGENIQVCDLSGAIEFSDLSGSAPQAACCAVIKDFLMVGNIASVPNEVWWSAINDPTLWPAIGSSEAKAVQSDNQILPEGGTVQGIIGTVGGADGAIFLEEAIYRLLYVGSPVIFQIDKVERIKGTRIPGGIVNIGIIAFYIGIDGFYAFDGTNSVPIGNEKIDRMFFDDFESSYSYRVTSAVDPYNKQVMWAYPGKDNIGGMPNKILIYNWAIQRWTLIEQQIEMFFRSFSTGYTLEDLDQFGTLDNLPYSLDSREWSGGIVSLLAFGDEHKVGSFSGSNLEATIDTGEFDAGNGQRVFISGIRPVVDTDSATVSLGSRNGRGDAVNYTAPTASGPDGVCPQRLSTRYARVRVQIPAGTDWSHAQGVEPIVQPDGDR